MPRCRDREGVRAAPGAVAAGSQSEQPALAEPRARSCGRWRLPRAPARWPGRKSYRLPKPARQASSVFRRQLVGLQHQPLDAPVILEVRLEDFVIVGLRFESVPDAFREI